MDKHPMAGNATKRNNYLIRSSSLANAWSPQEIRQLRELAQAGVPLQSIATRLGRSPSAIRNKAGFHAISVRS